MCQDCEGQEKQAGAKAEIAAKDEARRALPKEALELRWFVDKEMPTALIAEVGEDSYQAWFASMQFENVTEGVVELSVGIKFVQSWLQQRYVTTLLEVFAKRFSYVRSISISVRTPELRRRDRDPAGQRT